MNVGFFFWLLWRLRGSCNFFLIFERQKLDGVLSHRHEANNGIWLPPPRAP